MRWLVVGGLVLASICGSCSLTAAEKAVQIGETVDSLRFKDIRALPRSLDDLGEAKAYVFVFTNATCPLVQKYLPRLKSLHETYREQGVQFVAVNVGHAETIRDMAAYSLRNELLFPIVKDDNCEMARRLGVERTPEVAVLDAEKQLVYRGRIDDQYRLGGTLPQPRRSDLEAALKELLAGQPVSVSTTTVDGCHITFPDTKETNETKLTYAKEIAPIIESGCVRCHRAGTAAPFALTTFDEVAAQGEMIAEVVRDERMPPWYASPDHGKFQNDASLKSSERAAIVEWVEGGMPAGDLSALAKQPEAEPTREWRIATPDLVVTMLEEHKLPAEGLLPYEYVVFPHVFLRETWLEGIEIRPDNPTVVHHANLGYMAAGQKPGKETFITGYVPGGQPMDLSRFDNGVAFKIPALSVLGIQIHYTTTGKPERSKISVGLRFSKRPVKKQLRFNLLDTHRFRIPPHHPAFPVRDSFTLESDVTLLGLFTHMHVRGKDMTFFAHLPDQSTQTLLEIPNYNFEWQLGYEIAPGTVKLPIGTRVEAVAHYDNSAFNPFNPDPNAEIRYGLQTNDEMMNGYVFFTRDDEELNLEVSPRTGWVIGKE